ATPSKRQTEIGRKPRCLGNREGRASQMNLCRRALSERPPHAAPAPDGFFDRSQAGRRNSIATQDYGTEELAADRTQMTRKTKILPTILSSLFRDLDCL